MTALNKQALREAAERAASDSWGYDRDEFNDAITPEVVLALLDELEAKEKYANDRDAENEDLMLTVGRLRVEREAREAEIDEKLCKLLPGCQYMDPPDGGSVPPLEQVSRMVADYRERMEAAERRNADLEAELQNYHERPVWMINDAHEWERKAINNFEECGKLSQRIADVEAAATDKGE